MRVDPASVTNFNKMDAVRAGLGRRGSDAQRASSQLSVDCQPHSTPSRLAGSGIGRSVRQCRMHRAPKYFQFASVFGEVAMALRLPSQSASLRASPRYISR